MSRHSYGRARNRVQTLPLAFAALLFAALSSNAYAQSGGVDTDPGDRGTGGNNSIQGHIYFPSGQTLDRRVNVTLTSVASAPKTVMADDNGEFIFRRLSPASYTVTVDAGKEFATPPETVYIISGSAGRNYTVQIRLKYKASVSMKPDVLDASLLSVPPPALKLYQKAQASARDGDARKAIKQLEDALVAYPQFALALSELGFQYLQLNELDKAVVALQSAIKLAPDAFAPRLTYGRLLIRQGQFAQAEAELRRALKANDTSAQAHFNLARALLAQNNYDGAEKELKNTVALGNDEISEAHRFLGAIYNERGDAKRAIEELETYLRQSPDAKDAPQIRSIIKQLRAQSAAKNQ